MGVNNRLDEIQALFLNVKLKFLDDDNAQRVAIAKRYLVEVKTQELNYPSLMVCGIMCFTYLLSW